ncbi:MAG: Coenzyme F420 hydrogenase/dehydrogenase, beta subunit C-terminal domain [Oscillospiraceae bacterium]|jgi:coenzyme F420-reducing hydrogenase beta subunit|nr:Coenzyme F420 hydrogenase/dehydrogenase, beta subunit C-terminal domain [Oscillospiraceae bacterium]
MIDIKDKKNCCGCSACKIVCPVEDCIKMLPDEEGFLYPKANAGCCVECGLCEMVCPVLNPVEEKPLAQEAYLVQNKDERIRAESTSGGAFSAIASYVLQRGGAVFGAVMNDEHKVSHGYTEQESGLRHFRNSKYVQSRMGENFRIAERFLRGGRPVCFSGAPCQIEGFAQYLGRGYDNLILVDVVCRAVASPLVFAKYISWQKQKIGRDFGKVRFRDKRFYGYRYSQITISEKDAENQVIYHGGVESDPYLRAFFSDICQRPSCHDCKFRKLHRISDFTLSDCFEPDTHAPELDDGKGTTRLLIHSEKGRAVFREIKSKLRYIKLKPEEAVKGLRELREPLPESPRRREFFKDLNQLEPAELFEKYFPDTLSVRAERGARRAAHAMGFYKYMRKAYRKLKGKE